MQLLWRFKQGLVAPLRRYQAERALPNAYRAVARFPAVRGKRHRLPAPLILSLTSFPPRYATLPLTLKSLLDQKTKPDRTILWIAEGADWDALTPEIFALQAHGLEILPCEDVKSFNKLVPTVELVPDAFIVTADDDIYYDPDWLASLVDGYLSGEPAICARRVHRIAREADGRMAPYAAWDLYTVYPRDAGAQARDMFPTGIGGVIYPPGSLSPDVTDRALLTRLCPKADDVWFYWMGRRAGSGYRQVGPWFQPLPWDGSQVMTLYLDNELGGNDRQIAAMETHFGLA